MSEIDIDLMVYRQLKRWEAKRKARNKIVTEAGLNAPLFPASVTSTQELKGGDNK